LDLRDYLRVLSRRWKAIALITVLGAGAGVLVTQAMPSQYRATATLFVSIQGGGNTAELNQGNVFTQSRVQSYVEVARSPSVTRPVVARLRLGMQPRQLAKKISASAQLDTVLIRLTVTDRQPRHAARISNAVAQRFAMAVADLERPPGEKRSPVRLSVMEPAAVPTTAASPRPVMNFGLGILVGLVCGIAFAHAREALDTSVRSSHALSGLLAGINGPPVLGTIPFDPRITRRPVASRDDTHGGRAEGFRRLRTNLQFVDVDRPPKVIAVTSALSGEGKTNVAINLAATLAEDGESVCLVDTDLRQPTAARLLGLVRDAGLTTVLIGQAQVDDVLQSAGSFSVLTSGRIPPNPTELLGTEHMRDLLATLARQYDHVVLDTSPVLPVADTSVIGPAVDGYLLVVRAGRTTRHQIADAVRTIQQVKTPLIGTTLNGAATKGDSYGYGYGYGYRHHSPSRLSALLRRKSAQTADLAVHPATVPAAVVKKHADAETPAGRRPPGEPTDDPRSELADRGAR
jgi:non-specific protein-tyrosine kinase